VDSRNEISGSPVQSRGHDRSLVSALNKRRLRSSPSTRAQPVDMLGGGGAGKNAAALVAVLAARLRRKRGWGERGRAGAGSERFPRHRGPPPGY